MKSRTEFGHRGFRDDSIIFVWFRAFLNRYEHGSMPQRQTVRSIGREIIRFDDGQTQKLKSGPIVTTNSCDESHSGYPIISQYDATDTIFNTVELQETDRTSDKTDDSDRIRQKLS